MAFIDNPTIATLGSAIGLGPLFNAASAPNATPSTTATPPAANPLAQGPTAADNSQTMQPYELAENLGAPQIQAPTIRPGKSPAPIPEYKSRPYLPHIIGNPGSSGGVRPGALPQTTPGVMDPATLQSPEVQALLKSYGVTPSTAAPDPNLFIHNPNAFQRHPVMAGLLERGLDSAANMHVGDNFLDSFSGTLKGNQEAEAQRAQRANAQTMAPINQATAIQALLLGKQRQDLDSAKEKEDAEYHAGLISHYSAMDATRGERIASIPPRFDKQGRPYYYSEDPDTHKPSWEPDKDWQPDPRTALSQAIYDRESKALQTKYPSDDPHDPYKNVPPQELEDAYNRAASQESLSKAAGAAKVAGIRGAATVQAAGIRGGGSGGSGGRMSQFDRSRLAQLQADDATHNRALTNAENPNNMRVLDDDGKMIVADPSNPDFARYTKNHRDALSRNAAERARINSKYQTGAPNVQPQAVPTQTQSSPAPSANPFRTGN